MEEKINDLYEHIAKAKEIAIRDGIKANMIIISPSVAKVNGFPMAVSHTYGMKEFKKEIVEVPPMIMGLEVQYDEIVRDYGAYFIIAEKPKNREKKSLEDYSTDELLEEIRRRMEQ